MSDAMWTFESKAPLHGGESVRCTPNQRVCGICGRCFKKGGVFANHTRQCLNQAITEA